MYDLSISLDICSETAKKYQGEYFELKGENELADHLKDKDISSLVSISREIKERGLSVGQIDTALKLYLSVNRLEKQENELSASIRLKRTEYL